MSAGAGRGAGSGTALTPIPGSLAQIPHAYLPTVDPAGLRAGTAEDKQMQEKREALMSQCRKQPPLTSLLPQGVLLGADRNHMGQDELPQAPVAGCEDSSSTSLVPACQCHQCRPLKGLQLGWKPY